MPFELVIISYIINFKGKISFPFRVICLDEYFEILEDIISVSIFRDSPYPSVDEYAAIARILKTSENSLWSFKDKECRCFLQFDGINIPERKWNIIFQILCLEL